MHSAAVVEQGGFGAKGIILTQSSTVLVIHRNQDEATRTQDRAFGAHLFPTESEVKAEQIIRGPVYSKHH